MKFKTKVQSSVSLYWIGKYVLWVIPVLSVYALYLSFSSLGQEKEEMQFLMFDLSWAWQAFLAYAIVQFSFVAKRWHWIEYTWDKFIVHRKDEKVEYLWKDLRSVSKVIGATPPIYKVKFRNKDTPVYFSMTWKCRTFLIWSWDGSGFYEFAKNWIEIENEKKKGVNQSAHTTPVSAPR